MDSFKENGKSLRESEINLRRQLLYQEVRKQQNGIYFSDNVNKYNTKKPRRICHPKSKRVHLSKIKIENYLRCDPCSCIYLDDADYYKHMINFHQKYNTIIPRLRRKSPVRIPDKGNLIDAVCKSNGSKTEVSDNKINTIKITGIREKIKTRWSEILLAQSLPQSHMIPIKYEPITDDQIDMCQLLTKVEVQIKTEPEDNSTCENVNNY